MSANDALEEALCFGWIDGQMRSIDDKTYVKYFSVRGKNSKWSDNNKAIAEELEKQGVMTDYGRHMYGHILTLKRMLDVLSAYLG